VTGRTCTRPGLPRLWAGPVAVVEHDGGEGSCGNGVELGVESVAVRQTVSEEEVEAERRPVGP
jgi:hypothetical protein